MTIPTPGALGAFMGALTTLEGTINQNLPGGYDTLRVYRWRPHGMPELPALYHWLAPSESALMDTGFRQRDTLHLLCRIAVPHTDDDEEMAKVETYADAFRDVIDRDLKRPTASTLNAVSYYGDRTNMRTVLDTFNETDVLCVEFTLQTQIDRQLT